MKLLYKKLWLIINISFCITDPILPSYERDEGDWPFGVEKNMKNVIDRWFIDITDAKCKPLEYRGIKGNYNNFASKGLCEMHGILTKREKLQGCKKQMHPGHCVKNEITEPMYYFDQTTARCNHFQYNGCGGSFNRYKSDKECYLYCLNKKNGGLTNADDSKINSLENKNDYIVPNSLDCELRPDVKDKDPSTAIIADTKKNKCAYAAVSIDSNTRGIFGSFGECVKKCFPNASNAAISGDVTNENKKVAACEGDPFQHAKTGEGDDENTVFRYYYDTKADVCKRMESGPATTDFNRNENNFPTMEMCHSYCGAANYRKEIEIQETCTLDKKGDWSTGKTFQAIRYYYESASKTCKKFKYKGYDGNSNNFRTGEKCKAICEGHYNENVPVTIDQTEPQ